MFLLVLLGISISLALDVSLNLIPETGSPPPPRLYLVMGYSPSLNGLLIFSGSLNSKKYYNDLWIFLLDSLTWNAVYPTTSNAPCNPYLAARINGGAYYDPVSNQFFVFGGISMNGPQNDIWRFSFLSYSWYQISTVNTFKARYRFGYGGYTDTDGSVKIMVFGGSLSSGYTNELYIYDVNSMTWNLQPSDGDVPPALNGPRIRHYSGYIYSIGGEASALPVPEIYYNNTYRYNLGTSKWELLNLAADYSYRYFTGSVIVSNYLYLFYGWSNQDNIDVDSVYRLNLDELVGWEEFPITNPDSNILVRDSFGIVTDGSSVYLFGGYNANAESTLNSLVKVDVNTGTWELLTKDFSVPTARMMHSLEVIDGKFYLFGGVDGITIYDDFWIFDPSAIQWQSLNSTGDSPSARYAHSSSAEGNTMVIWGGMGTSQYLNDMYEFNSIDAVWTLVTYSGTAVPSSRIGACLVVSLPLIIIHGGLTSTDFKNDVWIFDVSSNSYSMYMDDNKIMTPRAFHRCELYKESSGNMLIYSINGKTDGEEAVGSIWYLNYTEQQWNLVIDSSVDKRGSGLAKIIGSSFVMISGENWSVDPYYDVSIIQDINNPVLSNIGKISTCIYSSAYVYFNKSIYSHGGGSYLGNILRSSISTTWFYRIDIEKLCDSTGLCKGLCSPGTYYDGTACRICSEGSYSENYNQDSCDKCQTGTFNANQGASSSRECYPCEEGTYNDKSGAAYCIDCPAGTNCPAGSKVPISSPIVSQILSVQPDIYNEISPEAQQASNLALYFIVAIMIVYVVLVIVFFNKISENLKLLDLYKHMHTYELETPVILRRTSIGGAFAIIFFLVAILIIVSTVITYTMSNTLELKSLVPLVIIENEVSDFRSDIYSKIILFNYGANCTSETGSCSDEISLNSYKIYGDSSSYVCGIENNNDCAIEYYCTNCTIETSASIEIVMSEKLSYCSAITVNVTTDSSIPGYISSILETILPPESTILRGSTPSYFYFTAIPSLFKTSINDNNPDTGYHISAEINAELGSYYEISELAFTNDLKVNIMLEKSDSSLYTLRYQKTTLIMLFNGLLGSVFGVMGAVGAVMRFFEGNKLKIEKKISDKERIGKMINSRSSYKNQFNKNGISNSKLEQDGTEEENS